MGLKSAPVSGGCILFSRRICPLEASKVRRVVVEPLGPENGVAMAVYKKIHIGVTKS